MKKLFLKDGKINYLFLFWVGLAVLMLARAFYFGFDYFNYLDDNNTYGVFYRRNDDIWNNIVKWYGLYTFRPIAFMCDAYITQWFWPHMELVLLFYTLMHFVSVALFKDTMEKSGVNLGVAGIIICTLTPILIEAAYWIGASTRLVPGMFFSILSCWILVKLINNDFQHKKTALILFFLSNLISTGFYEQIIVFNFVFTIAVILLNFEKVKSYRKTIIAVPFISSFVMGAYYIFFWNSGKVASRGQMADTGFIAQCAQTVKGIANLLIFKNFHMMLEGTIGFFNIQLSPVNIIVVLLALLFAGFSGLLVIKNIPNGAIKNIAIKAIGGIILSIAPFAPFFVLKNNYMSFRAVFPSIFGIAIFFDAVVDLLSRFRWGRICSGVLTAMAAILFFIIGVTEINNYRLVEIDDNIIAENFLAEFDKYNISDKDTLIVLGIEYLYSDTSRADYENIASSDWAFLGKLNAVSDKYYFTSIIPIKDGRSFKSEQLGESTALFGIDKDMSINRLYLQEGELFTESGEAFGELSASDGYYVLKVKQQ